MRLLPLLLCLLLAAPSGAFAQSRVPEDDDTRALRRARTMIWTGVGLMGLGVMMIPVSRVTGDSPDRSLTTAGVVSFGAGSVLTYVGYTRQRRIMNKSTTVRVAIGRVTAVQFVRSW